MPNSDFTNQIAEKYYKLLEDYHEVSNELRQVRSTLQKEYNFAEEKIQRVKFLESFIDSDKDIAAKFAEFEKASISNGEE